MFVYLPCIEYFLSEIALSEQAIEDVDAFRVPAFFLAATKTSDSVKYEGGRREMSSNSKPARARRRRLLLFLN